MGDHSIKSTRPGIHRQHDDWDDVHNQMIEVQQRGVQKKSADVNQPDDDDEKEADRVARKVAAGQNTVVGSTSSGLGLTRIDRKGNDEKSEEETDAETIHALLNRKEVDMDDYFEKEKQQKMTKTEQFEQKFPEVQPTYIDLPPDFIGIHTILEKYRNHPFKRMQLKAAYNRLYNEKLKSALDKKLDDTDYAISEDMLMSRFKRRNRDPNPTDLDPAVWTSNEFKKANRLVDVFEKESISGVFFKNVPKDVVVAQLRERISKPEEGIKQGATWMCGPSACSQVLLNYDPFNYVQIIIDLYKYGKSKQLGRMNASKDMSTVEVTLDPDLVNVQAKGTGMTVVDYFLVGAARRTANRQEMFVKGKKHFDPRNLEKHFAAGTLPWEIPDMLENLYGFRVEESGYWLGGENIHSIEAAVKANKIVMLFISHTIDDGYSSKKEYKGHGWKDRFGIHYVLIDNSKGFTISGDSITFTYWDYGGDSTLIDKIPIGGFQKSVKGYWIAIPKSME